MLEIAITDPTVWIDSKMHNVQPWLIHKVEKYPSWLHSRMHLWKTAKSKKDENV